jgi:Flp pilus assembly protein TadG
MRPERGQALVEFAVVLPVLILIILGILYCGRLCNFPS